MRSPRVIAALTAIPALALGGCASSGTGNADAAGDGPTHLTVMASFYPLQYIAEEVGGDLVEVESLTPPGTEPHDVELSPASVSALERSAAVVYVPGFQPAVDDAVKQARPENVVEISPGNSDPHFWLDPERLNDAAQSVAEKLSDIDPDNAAAYEANARSLADRLTALDSAFTEGLATCQSHTVVVSHEAYGHLTRKYGLKQVGISGLEPDTEPSPARLAEIAAVVKDEGVTTIFTETLVNPKVAETLAGDLNIRTAVLDPLEGLVDGSSDYEQIMRQNLETLRGALDCA